MRISEAMFQFGYVSISVSCGVSFRTRDQGLKAVGAALASASRYCSPLCIVEWKCCWYCCVRRLCHC
jgi:hypothetical protein